MTSASDLLERWRALDDKAHARMRTVGRAAARLFGERGYLDVTMETIGTAAGLSKGGMYHYFQSKAEILFFVVNETIDDLLRGLPEELHTLPPGPERIGRLMKRQLDYYYGHLDEVKTLLNDRKLLPPPFAKLVDLKEQRYFRTVEHEIRAIVPSLDGGRLAAITFAFFGLCNWIPSWYRPDGPLSIDEIYEINFALFMRGLTAIPNTAPTTTP